jgi:hypothetical protein
VEGRSRSWLGPDPLPTSLERTPTLLRCLFLKRRHASGACECRGPTPGPRFGRSVVVESGAPASVSSCSRVLGHRARSLSFACSSEPSPNALTVGGLGIPPWTKYPNWNHSWPLDRFLLSPSGGPYRLDGMLPRRRVTLRNSICPRELWTSPFTSVSLWDRICQLAYRVTVDPQLGVRCGYAPADDSAVRYPRGLSGGSMSTAYTIPMV